MSVSLVVLRLELAEDYPLLPHLHFSAPRPKKSMAQPDPNQKKNQGIEDDLKLRAGQSKIPVEKFRGSREPQEITIETIENEADVPNTRRRSKALEKELGRCLSKADSFSSSVDSADLTKSHKAVLDKNDSPIDGNEEKKRDEETVLKKDAKESASDCQKDDSAEHGIKQKDVAQSYAEVAYSSSTDRWNSTVQFTTEIPFSSGNHFVEVTKGILHLYKENQRTTLAEEADRSEMLCIIGVPAAFTTRDLLLFTAPVSGQIENLRIIRESKPNQYMVLIKFRNQMSADEFYKKFDGVKFNTIEDEVCHLAFVAKIETVKESEVACLPLPGHTELPTCPVCLERMDESVEGILTILCNHSFHGSCLAKWGDTSCPVCRYCQTPEPEPDNRCFGCGSQDSLWICLICGHVGCGRYVDGHAYEHYLDTQHTYAMQLGNNRVWDYAGDNYVHRLVQNKADGKLVELEPRWIENEEKMDSMQLEYTYLLTSQLEAQRHYFEERLAMLETGSFKQLEEMKEKTKHAVDEMKQLEEKLSRVTKDKQALEKKLAQVTSKLNKHAAELKDEKEMNKCLRQNQHLWQQKLVTAEKGLKEFKETKDKEIQDLQEQVRDLMFYFEAQNKLQDVPNVTSQEIQEGQIVIGEAAAGTSTETTKSRKKKHR